MGELANKGFRSFNSLNSLTHTKLSAQVSHLQNTALTNHLMASQEMKEAFSLLQMPIVEAAQYLHQKIQENPLFEIISEYDCFEEEEDFTESFETSFDFRRGIEKFGEDYNIENWLSHEPSWFETICNQIRELFPSIRDYSKAQKIIGNLNPKGYLDVSTEELAALNQSTPQEIETIIEKIKSFFNGDIACKNLQEALLFQLEKKGKKESLAYKIISNCYQELINSKFKDIAKSLKQPYSLIRDVVEKEISSLNIFTKLEKEPVSQLLIPDITIFTLDGQFHIVINEDELPRLKINTEYLSLFNEQALPKESQLYLKEKINQAQWLLKTLKERKNTLYKIAEQLLLLQTEYFSRENGYLRPLTIKQMAECLTLHESTISRAVSNKFLACDRGIISLKSFFTSSLQSFDGECVSSSQIKERIISFIKEECSLQPLTDEEITDKLASEGFICARRTVAKYRKELKIPSKRERRSF